MIRKLTLAAGFGAGYVLGAKAGKERYNQIQGKFRELAGLPAVQDIKSNLADTAGQVGEKARSAVNDTVTAVGDKVTGGTNDVVDLGAAPPATPPATTAPATKPPARKAPAPMTGTAPSVTAPDQPTR